MICGCELLTHIHVLLSVLLVGEGSVFSKVPFKYNSTNHNIPNVVSLSSLDHPPSPSLLASANDFTPPNFTFTFPLSSQSVMVKKNDLPLHFLVKLKCRAQLQLSKLDKSSNLSIGFPCKRKFSSPPASLDSKKQVKTQKQKN